MGQRLKLQELLEAIPGVKEVYFQEPGNTTMVYPCIIYKREQAETKFADNSPYNHTQRYAVTIIDRNPDSLIPGIVARLPMCLFNRHFRVDGLNHDTYNLYF